MRLRYVPKHTLSHEHVDAVTAVAFSADGCLLASGGQDGKLTIWSLNTGQALYRVVAKSGVSCLLWPKCSNSILAGTADGTLVMFTLDECDRRTDPLLLNEKLVTASGFVAHGEPIESLSLNCHATIGIRPSDSGDSPVSPWAQQSSTASLDVSESCTEHLLATAAGATVNIWDWDQGTDKNCSPAAKFWQQFHTLGQPQPTPFNLSQPVEVVKVQWLAPPQENCIVVSYLNHGIICWKLSENHFDVKWTIYMPVCGSFDIAPDNTCLAVCNIFKGFDIYEIPSGLHRLTLPISEEDIHRMLPVIFHRGQLLLIGSEVGKVSLHNSEDEKVLVQALAAFYSSTDDTYVIAAGTGVQNSDNYIQIWETLSVE
ncbi:WD40 repeat-like protein [Laetiporus sulphureus 93-53]|uniref:WD40 repeat-like protein n=1 Tax=Laetiporus sulphureus 93-53 TaxID=1314785 RepID=A0A165CJA1_9APHY|nr:WD40 repeat-like protein [Laetiporus sulphureus 93-53]KZT02912.1 WD40 repeat-like protein [Laetiporus sulphureus 93-53]